jgi:hypothetical protein
VESFGLRLRRLRRWIAAGSVDQGVALEFGCPESFRAQVHDCRTASTDAWKTAQQAALPEQLRRDAPRKVAIPAPVRGVAARQLAADSVSVVVANSKVSLPSVLARQSY